MKLNVNEKGNIVLEEVFVGLTLKSGDGEEFGICMRDSGFEFMYGDQLWQAKEGKVQKICDVVMKDGDEDIPQTPHDGLRFDIVLEGLVKGIAVPVTFEPRTEPRDRIEGILSMNSEGWLSLDVGTTQHYGKANPTDENVKEAWEKLKIKFNR